MGILDDDKYKPYTHQISLSSSVINKLFAQTGSKLLLPAQGKGSQRGIFGRACVLFFIYLSREIQAMSLAVESVAQDSFRY
ncbi:hypothetical protein CY34DRAFT_808628 [Suillus luteus UH-Slu-Lm8-n1]|uniref:Uncharacterized protein n=1 Tax=Suillus luteus UH-Slu-Lm8-n1 TaxID=930992 RepID=A0A0D0AM16_9AGAM|nr:hypothetical protein CY34DRAFT_808628 [Suillus luteus UH-Slu-Lm8-n1]